MSIGDCFVPVMHTPGQLSGPKEEFDGPYDVKCANRLCGVSFIASVPLQGRSESLRVACVAGAKRGGGGGGRKCESRENGREPYPLSPIPLPFSLNPYPLPLSMPAMQASLREREGTLGK